MEELHKPVMLSEVLEVLAPKSGETYLDLTAGYAGHASEILAVTRQYKGSVLVDRDDFAIKYLRGKYESEPVEIVKDDFCAAAQSLIECGKTFDMILADFGVSSPQLDLASRGFSFRAEAPLDMRMDRSQRLSAETVVNHYRERELEEIFVKYGEESPGLAQRHAKMIVHGRPWRTTTELADALGSKRYGHIHPATKVFQAIRIEVNDELGLIERTLPKLPKLLNPGGRVAIISFHSLEDRLVKEYFREESSNGEESELEVLTKKPITAG
jgi:16S rRNA (cytosine1402-N4)-methyltransferase